MTPHKCEYHCVDGTENVYFCSCGNVYSSDSQGAWGISYAAALPVDALSPDALQEALASLGAAGSVLLGSSAPVLVAATISGIIVYFAVRLTESGAVVREAAADSRKLDGEYQPDKGFYYDTSLNKKDGFMYINIANPMTISEAKRHLSYHIFFAWSFSHCNQFIYTVLEDDAESLAKEFCRQHVDYHWAKDQLHGTGGPGCKHQFEHFHIVSKYGSHLGTHILFGAPCGMLAAA